MNELGVPRFGRLEILMKDRRAVKAAADRLRALASSLDAIVKDNPDEGTAMLLAYRRIRKISDHTRKGE